MRRGRKSRGRAKTEVSPFRSFVLFPPSPPFSFVYTRRYARRSLAAYLARKGTTRHDLTPPRVSSTIFDSTKRFDRVIPWWLEPLSLPRSRVQLRAFSTDVSRRASLRTLSLPFCPLCLGSAANVSYFRVKEKKSANVETSWILIGTETRPIPSNFTQNQFPSRFDVPE